MDSEVQTWISCLLVGIAVALQTVVSATKCGSFIDVKGESSGRINSPRYPLPYPNHSRCIWLIQSENYKRIRLDINEVKGDEFRGECSDYLEIRDGSSQEALRLRTCNMTSPMVLLSSAKWFWLKFVSDGEYTNTGFQVEWQTYHTGDDFSKVPSPVPICRSFRFLCANKECVSTSYLCDNRNDCGCGKGCDEDDCAGLPITKGEQVAVGISVGVFGFLVVVCVVIAMDRHQHNSVWQKIASVRQKDTHRLVR